MALSAATAVPAQDFWTPIPPVTPARYAPSVFSAESLAYDIAGDCVVLFSDGDTWEWKSDAWTLVTTLSPGGRTGHRMAYDRTRSRVILFGGRALDQSASDSATWEWTGSTWRVIATLGPSPRSDHAMTADSSRNEIVLHGGANGGQSLQDTWVWDGIGWSERVVSGPSPRAKHAMAFDASRGRAVLYGGLSNAQPMDDTWEWDGASWTQLPQAGPAMSAEHVLGYDATRGQVVMSGLLQTPGTWAWDGSAWGMVSARFRTNRSAIAEDALRSRLVAFGGTLQDDTVDVWDGVSWSVATPPSQPPRNPGVDMVWDPASTSVLLFGDQFRRASERYTWLWNGERWSGLDVGGPVPRAFHAMASDTTGQQVLLFGGFDGARQETDETWQWDGAAWTQLQVTGPAARVSSAMVHDPVRGRTVLFGGLDAGAGIAFGDTWEFDGVQWALVATTGPVARWGHAMAYDAVRGRVVLYGGSAASVGDPISTWEWDGAQWQEFTHLGRPVGSGHRMVFDEALGRVVLGNISRSYSWTGSLWQRESWPDASGSVFLAYDAARQRRVAFTGRPGTSNMWELTPHITGGVVSAGAGGCEGARGVPLLMSSRTRPVRGQGFELEVRNLPFGQQPVFGAVGLPIAGPVGSVPLDVIGMPGCSLFVDIVATRLLARSADRAQWTLSIGSQAALVGFRLSMQAFAVDTRANALGLSASNALVVTVE